MQFRPPQEPEYTQSQTYYPPPRPTAYPLPGYYLPPQGYLPGPVPPQPRPVNTNIKIGSIACFASATLIVVLGGLSALTLAELLNLAGFILIFFI